MINLRLTSVFSCAGSAELVLLSTTQPDPTIVFQPDPTIVKPEVVRPEGVKPENGLSRKHSA